jgi:hypothetical protein
MKEDCLRIAAGEPTPMQLLAWQRLWALLLAPADSKSPDTASECRAKPEPAPCDGQDAQLNEG